MPRQRKHFVIVALTMLLIIAGLPIGYRAFDSYLDPFDDRLFDAATWGAADARRRGPMARDALRQLSAGMSSAGVRELLGEPKPVERDPRGPVDVYGNRLEHPETWSYYLGSWSGLGPYGFDDAFLYVHFNNDGKVVAAEITGG